MIRIKFKQPYLSIKDFNEIDLPDFTMLIGRNGVGKTHLLEAIKENCLSVEGISSSEIEIYNLDSFRLKDSQDASWGSSSLVARTVEKYFTSSSDLAPVKLAKKIFKQHINTFDRFDGRRQFEEELRNAIVEMRAFGQLGSNNAQVTYCEEIQSRVINPLKEREGHSGNTRDDPASLVTLAMKLTAKFPHEICRDDILRAANFDGDIIENTLNEVFTRYKFDQYVWAHMEGEKSTLSFQNLMSQYRDENTPPWEILQENLDQMRETSGDPELFSFDFSDPENDRLNFTDHPQYSFETKMTNRATGTSYSVTNLSSGEKILMSLFLAAFNQSIGRRQPKLLLLDEVDVVLHPSMISALIIGLKNLFVKNGTRVIMATHSVTTVSLLEEGEIYRASRKDNKVDVSPVTKSEAVSELSEGIATIETGLRIVSSIAPITILTEGNNTLHLKKWASLFYSKEVEVFDALPDRTGATHLKTYSELLAHMETNSHFLIVWDCDAKSTAQKLAGELPETANVTAFAFEERENKIASKGIENKYDEEVLEPFANQIIRPMGRGVQYSFGNEEKTEFAEFIVKNGTAEHFQHFDDLKLVVKEILEQLKNQK